MKRAEILMVFAVIACTGTLAYHLQAEKKFVQDAKKDPQRAIAVLHSIEPKPLEIRKAVMEVKNPEDKKD